MDYGCRLFLVLVHVDDIVVAWKTDQQKDIKDILINKLRMKHGVKDLGRIRFDLRLNIQIDGCIMININQNIYSKQLFQQYGFSDMYTSRVPIEVNVHFTRSDETNSGSDTSDGTVFPYR